MFSGKFSKYFSDPFGDGVTGRVLLLARGRRALKSVEQDFQDVQSGASRADPNALNRRKRVEFSAPYLARGESQGVPKPSDELAMGALVWV